MELKDWTCAVMESLKVMFTFFHWTKGTFAENVATSVTVQVRLLWWHFRSKSPVEAYFVYSTSWKHAWSFQGFERWSNYETSLIFESHTHIKWSKKQQCGMNFQHLSAACCFLDTDAMSIQWTWSDANLLKRGQGECFASPLDPQLPWVRWGFRRDPLAFVFLAVGKTIKDFMA